MKRIILIIVAIIAFNSNIKADNGGQCGDYLTWYYESDSKTLRIIGHGDMYDYDIFNNDTPWEGFASTIKTVIIGDSVTSIGNNAFRQCIRMESLTIGNSVTRIGDYSFDSCQKLSSVDFPDSLTTIGAYAFSGTPLTSLDFNDSLVTIGDAAFVFCSGLKSINIPNSVTYIGDYAFSNCYYVKSINIGNSVETIGDFAFRMCNDLESAYIPESVKSLGINIFSDCIGLSSIMVDSENKFYDSRDSCNAIIEKATNTLISGCNNSTIPNSIKIIGKCAFYGSYITTAKIGDEVTVIDSSAFSFCKRLITLKFGNGIREIGDRAFEGCESLHNLTIPNSVISIGNCAFMSCDHLSTVKIGNYVKSIGDHAFYSCSFNTLTIGYSVETIGLKAFYSNRYIIRIYCKCPIPPICDDLVFESKVENDAVLYVTEGHSDVYSNASTWEDFVHIREYYDGIEDIKDESFIIYPNPATECININCDRALQLDIYSIYGRHIFSGNLSETTTQIDISDWENTVYIYTIYFKDGELTKGRFVKNM